MNEDTLERRLLANAGNALESLAVKLKHDVSGIVGISQYEARKTS